MNGQRIVAVVVTFNRKDLLIECIPSLQAQTVPITDIICIDNASTDGTGELLFTKSFLPRNPKDRENDTDIYSIENTIPGLPGNPPITFRYYRLPGNTGGAGGFHEGVRLAAEIDCDWIWLMDDDAEPAPDALEKMSPFFNDRSILALAGKVYGKDNHIQMNHRGYFKFTNYPRMRIFLNDNDYNVSDRNIEFVSFVGPLIRRQAVFEIGLPRSDFFIHCDDFEYSYRLANHGTIKLIPSSLILHKDQAERTKNNKSFLFLGYRQIPYDRLWLDYFGRRNTAYMGKACYKKKSLFYIQLLIRFFKTCVGIILFDDHKLKRIYFYVCAYNEGLKGVFDNDRPKSILYGDK